MMSYDGLLSLSQLTDEKLNIVQGGTAAPSSTTNRTTNTTADQESFANVSNSSSTPDRLHLVVDVTVEEEEQAAIIQTIQLPLKSQQNDNDDGNGEAKRIVINNKTGVEPSASTAAPPPVTIVSADVENKPSTTATITENTAKTKTEAQQQQRKISASSRFMNAFQQFYASATTINNTNTITPTATNEIEEPYVVSANSTNDMPGAASTTNRTPSKGMESKLLSMWHNVKYGWSGKLKPNFSKEQPVWLLGRCYHRKCSPPSSMESSAELAANAGVLSVVAYEPSAAATAYETTEKSISADDGVGGFAAGHNGTDLYPSLPLNPQHIDEIVVPQELGMDAVENQVADQPWEEGIEGFRRDFYSRIWMTYRREFPTMNGTNYTSDCGWGCMLRSGQMLLAQGLVCHFLGRSWRFDADTQLHSTFEDNMHKKIIKWFGDSSSKSSPFSIHAMVSLGEEMGKKPGDWYGPASVSYLLKQALKTAAQENADFDNITIYVAKDCTIYMQDVEKECLIPNHSPKKHVPWQTTRRTETPKSQKQQWKSVILLVPLRLGTEKLNPVYAHCLKLLLSTEYCIGIIGGRPKHSLYFVGFQEDKLIHLDPHYCQEMVDVNQENFSLHSFHCKSPRKLKTTKMDPSCCVGFYCATKTDFDNFVEGVQPYLHPMRCASGTMDKLAAHSANNGEGGGGGDAEINYPLFTFSRGKCLEQDLDLIKNDSLYKSLQQQVVQMKQELNLHASSAHVTTVSANDEVDNDETEEFVLL